MSDEPTSPFRTCDVTFDGTKCDHGVTFDQAAADTEPRHTVQGVRRHWPRLNGECPKGCGFVGIAYASQAHFVYGDW